MWFASVSANPLERGQARQPTQGEQGYACLVSNAPLWLKTIAASETIRTTSKSQIRPHSEHQVQRFLHLVLKAAKF